MCRMVGGPPRIVFRHRHMWTPTDRQRGCTVRHGSKNKERKCGSVSNPGTDVPDVRDGSENRFFFLPTTLRVACVVPYRTCTNLAFDEIPLRARSIGLISHDFTNSQIPKFTEKYILKIDRYITLYFFVILC